MTIFFEVAKGFLIEKIKRSRNKSVADDASWVKGWLRNTDVSTAKQNLADDLVKEIAALKDAENDEVNLSNIKKLLTTCSDNMTKTAKAVGNEGNLGPALVKLAELIRKLYIALEDKKLINIDYDNDPFNIFCFYMAQYFATKIFYPSQNGIKGKVVNKFTKSHTLELEKEELVENILAKCEKKLARHDKKLPGYLKGRREEVLECIEELIRKNDELRNDHGVQADIPISLTFFTSVNIKSKKLKPRPGELRNYAREARKDINAYEEEQKEELITEGTSCT